MKYTYEMLRQDIGTIHQLIRSSGQKYDAIVALARGGAIPGVCLSHKLDIPVKLIDMSFRDLGRIDWDAIYDIKHEIKSGFNFLVVDDILDSGRTLKEFYAAIIGPADLAVLIDNVSCPMPFKATYAGRTIDRRFDKEWVDFWWEEK